MYNCVPRAFAMQAKSENSLQQKHVYVHVPRDLPDANMVLKIASLYGTYAHNSAVHSLTHGR